MVEQTWVQIQVQDWISKRWEKWFEGMTMGHQGEQACSPITLLTGRVADQAALRGLLIKMWDLNLTLVSVTVGNTSTGLEGNEANE